MTTEPKHYLALGETIQSKYSTLGGMVGRQILDPAKMLMLLWGFPDAGKSTFIEGNKDAYIFNCDGTSTSNPDPKAIIYPGFNQQGLPVNEKMVPTPFTYDELLKKVVALEELSTKNLPRPETIVIDSLSSLITMLRDWVPENLYESSKGKPFHRLDGQAAWAALYGEAGNLIRRIRDAGYGCCVIAHLKKDVKNRGKDDEKESIFPTITVNFANQLLALFEMSVSISSSQEFKSSGKYERIVKLDAALAELMEQGIYKYRVPVEMVLPHVNGWDCFVEKYREALSKM